MLLKSKKMEYLLVTILTFFAFVLILQMFTGKYFWTRNPYNTYALQADSWRQGRLDLGENYGWLELAEYQGKYYCSFPTFPSYVYFPLTFFFHSNTPDGFVLMVFDFLAVLFLYLLGCHLRLSPEQSMITTLFLTIGTNMVFIIYNPAVWFIAQTMCFTLAILSIYSALKGRGGLSLFFWSCAVGCRPMQALYLPVLLFLIYQEERKKAPDKAWYRLILDRWRWGIAPAVMAISYMLLNYFKFGNVLEFGHNYLPEFMYEHIQFSTSYLGNNLKMLLQLPTFNEEGRMVINHFGSLNFLLVNSPVLLFVLALILAAVLKEKDTVLTGSLILILSIGYLVITMMHATMGGWHFGNRYTNDILPWTYLPLAMVLARHPKLVKYQIPFLTFGMVLNVVGTVVVYNGL